MNGQTASGRANPKLSTTPVSALALSPRSLTRHSLNMSVRSRLLADWQPAVAALRAAPSTACPARRRRRCTMGSSHRCTRSLARAWRRLRTSATAPSAKRGCRPRWAELRHRRAVVIIYRRRAAFVRGQTLLSRHYALSSRLLGWLIRSVFSWYITLYDYSRVIFWLFHRHTLARFQRLTTSDSATHTRYVTSHGDQVLRKDGRPRDLRDTICLSRTSD